jgi:pimeloyl-ACP methyl ester carboxylesterase
LVGSRDYRDAGPLRGTFVRVVREDLRELLPRIQARTLLVWGEEDREVPTEIAHAMAEAIPNATLEIIARAGHFCFLDQHDYFRLLVAKFLR